MAAITPVLTQVAVSALAAQQSRQASKAQQKLALRQLQETQAASLQKAQEDAQAQRAEIELSAQQDEEERRSALKRAVARQRAQFGAQGIGTNGSGSAQAVLLGLFEESDDERERREQLDALRTQSLETGLAQQVRINTLQRTQLQQRQNLDRTLQDQSLALDLISGF